ncbi:MAG: R3H domain-containing nucleic acid-binding protein [Patescibacteria group bacterium]
MSDTSLNKIKQLVEEFFAKMGIMAEVRDLSRKDNVVLVGIKAEEPQELIGERGKTLCEIQRLLMSIAKRQIDEPFFLDLDINDYKKKKAEYLTEMAVSLANDVSLDGRERELPIMLAMERRVVHMALAGRTDVAAESVGEEPERRIIIKAA